MNLAIITTHKLEFLSRPWHIVIDDEHWNQYKIGTVTGLWRATDKSYEILAFENSETGNGHLNDVFEWFENSCKRDNKSFRIREMMNENFKTHLVVKRGFKEILKTNDLIKHFK